MTQGRPANKMLSALCLKPLTRFSFSLLVLFAACCLLNACDSAPVEGNAALRDIRGEESSAPNRFFGDIKSSEVFATVERDNYLSLPSDHESHPDFQLEWWYLTFVLTSDTGEELGLQYTLFRFNTDSRGDQQHAKSHWANTQQWMGHASLHTKNRHYFEERFAAGKVGNAYVKRQPFTAVIDDWQWKSTATNNSKEAASESNGMFPSSLLFTFGNEKKNAKSNVVAMNAALPTATSPSSQYTIDNNAVSVSLNLSATGPFIKHGDNGYSKKTEDGRLRSYYYSQPFIQANGTVNIEGKTLKVSGKGWFDHEWTSHLANSQAMGWDWFSLHLDDGSKLMAFRMHASTGRSKNEKNEVYTTASYITTEGIKETIDQASISITPVKYETIKSGETNRTVPTAWQIRIPKKNINATVAAFKKNQWNDSLFPYYEGRVKISGSHSGSGFMELTGY